MKRLLIIGISVFVASLLLNFPAALGLKLFAPEGLAMHGVAGTIWSGRAAEASYLSTYLGEVNWRFRPLSLLLARAGYRVQSRSPVGNFDTRFAVGVTGALRIDALDGRTRLSSIASVLPPQVPVQLFDANLDLALSDIVLVEGWPTKAHGSILLSGVRMTGQSDNLGSYEINVAEAEEPDTLVAQFKDTDGPLQIEGTVDVQRDGNYSMNCKASPRANAPATLMAAVDLICPTG